MIYFASACSINLSLCCCFFLMCVPIIACCGVVTLQNVVPILGCYKNTTKRSYKLTVTSHICAYDLALSILHLSYKVYNNVI
jgi:hypothetical protein